MKATHDQSLQTLSNEAQRHLLRELRTCLSLVTALRRDDYVPVSIFSAWASVRRFREWRDDPAVKLDVVIKHGKTCVRPAAFFAHWATLPATRKRSTRPGAADRE